MTESSQTMNPAAIPSPTGAIELAFTGRRVELIALEAAEAEATTGDQGAITAAIRRSPLQSVSASGLARIAAELASAQPGMRVLIDELASASGDGAPCAIVVSLDGLAAYAVPADLPPDALAAISADELRGLLGAAGVVSGLLDDVIDTFGTGAPLADIRLLASGQDTVPGTDGWLEYHIDTGALSAPVTHESGAVDFHEVAAQRFVLEGAPLVTRHPPVPGTPGLDVRGDAIEAPAVGDVQLAPLSGPHTTVDGDDVIAGIVGRPIRNAQGGVEVLPVFEVAGDLDYAVGNIDFPGDVVIRGDVKPGFTIVSGGSVTVRGLVEGATITAARDLAVAGTVGEHPSVFEVGGDLTARYLHTTQARVAGAVNVTSEIVNSTITADRVSTAAQGRIVGGVITVRLGVDTGTIGSREGKLTDIRVMSDEADAVVRARRAVHPGVVVTIGELHRTLTDQLDGASFWNVGDAILSLAPSADIATAEAARAA